LEKILLVLEKLGAYKNLWNFSRTSTLQDFQKLLKKNQEFLEKTRVLTFKNILEVFRNFKTLLEISGIFRNRRKYLNISRSS
jgi:hypothetical protein